ncbi:MAG: cell wall-binding repeat-containing protein, partial [Janthinobacterium lividum]
MERGGGGRLATSRPPWGGKSLHSALEALVTAATSRLRRRGIGAGVAALVGLGSVAGLAGAAQAAPGFDPTSASAQVAGVDRFDTAARIATATFTTATTVVIANGDRVIDAQAAGYVAGMNNAPILLTQTGTVPQFTLDAIKKLGATKAIVIGDNVSVSAAARAQLTAAGLTQTNLTGMNRFDTAASIYNAGTTKSKTVFIARGDYATGMVSPDALAAGPLAYKGTPILLTNIDNLPAETRAALVSGGVTKVVYLGTGITQAVKDAVAAAIPTATAETIGGADRSLTAQLLANSSYGTAVYNKTSAAIANGERVDALAAGPWAAIKGTPILLTLGTNTIGTGTTGYLDANKATLTSATVFGDAKSVPPAFLALATTAANGGVVAGVTVTAGTAAGSFSYADPSTKAAVSVTPKSTDTFTVDGTPATLGAFLGQVTVGDTLVITPGASATSYALTNKTTASVTSGLIGNVNTGAMTTTVAFSVIEPITGTVLRDFAANSFPVANTFYTVDGANATSTTFLAAINEGDTLAVSVTGTGTSASTTYALTNTTVSGTVVTPTPGASAAFVSTFGVKTAAGATLGDIPGTAAASDTVYATTATDVLTVDGETATAEAFA